jgi:hypothetical protein
MVIKSIFKWGLRLGLVAVLLAVVFVLSLDSILRVVVEHNFRQQTRLRAEIGKFHLGLTQPVLEIKQLRLYNSPAFGGAPFLVIPEIYVEYDRAALARNEIHLTRLRFNLGELEIVKSLDGQTNLLALGVTLPAKPVNGAGAKQALGDLKRQTGLDFKGIDCLTVSVGSFRYVDLQNRKNDQEQVIGVENLTLTNVVSPADLAGLGLLVGLRSGDFFKPMLAPGDAGAGAAAQDLLKLLGR